ncbi:synaptic vesicular amine transporter-like [Teleopsis dalmanni]|uniref:synaptic vesicular amine transporter-like n=1 Tax=Teleopsis dalmanni TaxID=139649 RepID=UPI0018CFD136|nr:synaptic vesicular amine transporter-like [Teleopsis dalmanni]
MPEFPPETPVSSETHRGTTLNIASGTRSSTPNFGHTNRCTIAVIVYFALLLDNVLLTVIVPILPGYLASIDNKTHYTSLDTVGGFNAATSQSGSAILPQNIAYRNLDGSPNLQAVLTKHPIPAGKSMVNFTLPPTAIEDKSASAATTAAQRQIKHLVSSGNGTTIKNITAGNNNTVNNSSNGRRDEGKNGRNTMDTLSSENGSIGILLAMKALVQLIFNPIVGNLSSKRFGYRVPIVAGTFFLLVSSLVFAIGEAYFTLLLARAIQGIGSACIGVCGMSLVAQSYPEEGRRSKVMGIILGSIALGVLLGYPFGGILYDLIGKSAPFIILSAIIFLNLAMQLVTMDLSVQPEV